MAGPDDSQGLRPIRRALLSVSDKRGLVDLARALSGFDTELLSTGGTARELAEAGIAVREVADVTGFPEIMDGRVKTLHPTIHGALLGREGDAAVMREHGIDPIDLLAVNLYPFERTVARACPLAEAIEHIDIGGPAMLRAAAKNYPRVAVITDPAQLDAVIAELKQNDGALGLETRFELAREAFARATRYDAAISEYLTAVQSDGSRGDLPGQFSPVFTKAADLRYGENPHQSAAFYRDPEPAPGTFSTYRQLQGKALSYNNIADADTAWECVRQFETPACVIVKHANPCGVAEADDPLTAYRYAFATDPESAFGGIIAFNRALDDDAARAIIDRQFVEVVIAPAVSGEAREILAGKKNARVLEIPAGGAANRYDLKRLGGGLLVQTADRAGVTADQLEVVTHQRPDEAVRGDLLFAWRVARFVKSNAMVYCRDRRTLGVGAGQMSRVYSARIAAVKAADAGLDLAGAVLASDAFLPFRDSVDRAAEAGIRAIVQPGGSIRDCEVIEAANEHGLAMVFTGIRHFRH